MTDDDCPGVLINFTVQYYRRNVPLCKQTWVTWKVLYKLNVLSLLLLLMCLYAAVLPEERILCLVTGFIDQTYWFCVRDDWTAVVTDWMNYSFRFTSCEKQAVDQ